MFAKGTKGGPGRPKKPPGGDVPLVLPDGSLEPGYLSEFAGTLLLDAAVLKANADHLDRLSGEWVRCAAVAFRKDWAGVILFRCVVQAGAVQGESSVKLMRATDC